MVLRDMAAERISGLKKRVPVQTPVLEEIPRPATILSSVELAFQPVLGRVPVITRGKAYGETAGLWYRVTFLRPLIEPSVVAIGEGRRGVIPTPKAPTIAIASAEVPTAASIVIPAARTGHVPTSLGRFGCGWAISGLTDGLNDLVATMEFSLGRVNQVIDDLVRGFNETRNSLNSINAKIDDLRGKVNTALDTLRKNTEGAVNAGLVAVIPLLYDAWGIPRDMVITPLHTRNVTSTGFEFQSYGKTTCYYIAVGSLR